MTSTTDRPAAAPVACICGSTYQRADIAELNRRLTMAGRIVVAPGVFGHDGDPLTDDEKVALDRLHFAKIDLSDEVHFIRKPDGSFGESTEREYRYAVKQKGLLQVTDHDAVALRKPDPCPDHLPVQHRDARPPWCNQCGLTADGLKPVGRLDRKVQR